MKLLTRSELERICREVGRILSGPTEIILAGGCAVLAWCPDGTATKDMDGFRTEDFVVFSHALARWSRATGEEPVDANCRADAFEVFFPEDWREHICEARSLSSGRLRVLVPRPEDLAVSKVFRFLSKDADDIERLASLPPFQRERFLSGFLNVLPVAIGDARVHAQSFAMAWNGLYPGEPMDPQDVLKRAGRS